MWATSRFEGCYRACSRVLVYRYHALLGANEKEGEKTKRKGTSIIIFTRSRYCKDRILKNDTGGTSGEFFASHFQG